MDRKILMVCFGIFFIFNGLHGQDTLKVNLEWSEERPLTWKDYHIIKSRRSKREIALTSVKHSVRGELKGGIPDFVVKVTFVAKDSWTTDTTNLSLLAHEQLHFDIGELYRRKIVEKVRRLRDGGEKQKAIYRYVIKKMLSDFRNYSNEYDQETRFGNLKTEQRKWRDKVWEELKRLNK